MLEGAGFEDLAIGGASNTDGRFAGVGGVGGVSGEFGYIARHGHRVWGKLCGSSWVQG